MRQFHQTMVNDCFLAWQGTVDLLDRFDRRPASPILRLPGGNVAVVVVDALSPECVREIGPFIVLLKPGSGLQLLLVHVKDELVLKFGELECPPRYGEQLVPHTHEAAEGENRVGHTTFLGVNHQFVDLAQTFILEIDRRLPDNFGCRNDTLLGPYLHT